MARKKHRRKKAHHRRKKKHSSVGKRARKYYVSVKRNKSYRRKRRKSRAGTQTKMFGPRYRVVHKVKRIGRRRKHHSRHAGMGALTAAHHAICG